MGRNYFSRHGGPYFINDGFSRHADESEHDHKDIKPGPNLIYVLPIGIVSLLLIIGIAILN